MVLIFLEIWCKLEASSQAAEHVDYIAHTGLGYEGDADSGR